MNNFVSAELPVFRHGKRNLVLATCILLASQGAFAVQSGRGSETAGDVVAVERSVVPVENRKATDGIQQNLPLGIRNNPEDFGDALPEVSPEWTVSEPVTETLAIPNSPSIEKIKSVRSDKPVQPDAIPATKQEESLHEQNLPTDQVTVSSQIEDTDQQVPEPDESIQDGDKSQNSDPPEQAVSVLPEEPPGPEPVEPPDTTGVPDHLVEVPEDWVVTVISRTGGETLTPLPVAVPTPTSDEADASADNTETAESLPPEEEPVADPMIKVASPPVDIEPIDPSSLGDLKELPHSLILNDESYAGLKAYENASGKVLLPLASIAAILGDSVSIDEAEAGVSYVRSRDGARFRLNTETGEVLANGNKVGFLNEVKQIDTGLGLFPANAVQVFAGLHIKRDDEREQISLTLDKRLQYVSGFDLYVNGQQLPFLNPEPRSLGHVLLLPLRPIVEELGSRLEISPDNSEVTVTRYQDNARITLNLATGLIEVEDTPVGTAPNMAYADISQLLLPKESVASLTGTYVTIPPGSRRIDVDLDGQLARIIHPGDSIQSRAASSPPSVESVKAFYDSEHRASAVVRGNYSSYNLKLEYETPTTQGDDGFTPEWMQLFAESIDGWGLGVGDHSTQKGELTGVNASRIRGAYFYNPTKDGVLVGTLGKAQSGTRRLDGGDHIPTYDGEVGGVRYYANNGDFELGIAARNDDDSDSRSVVVSSFKVLDQPDFHLGDLYQRTEVAAGIYDTNNETELGGRFSWDGRLEPNSRFSLSARTDYSSSHLAGEIQAQENDDEDNNDIIDADRLAYGFGASYRPHQQLAYGVNHSRTVRGFLEDDGGGELESWAESSTASVSLKPFVSDFSPWTYFSWNRTTGSDDAAVRRLSGQAVWRLSKMNFLVKHEDQRVDGEDNTWLSSLQVSRDAWIRYFQKKSSLKLSPRFNAWKNSESLNANIGALLSFNSGELLGKRTTFGMAYGRNLGVQLLDKDDDDETLSDGNDYFTANLNFRFNRLLKFNSSYFSDLDGNDNTYASLTAYYEFNPPRNIKQSRENAGLLTGQVFLDENHDGIQQENEKGIPGARIAIKGSRLALNADPNGRFTIQNLPVGVYRIVPDMTRLPLGYLGNPEKIPPVRIGDSLITEMKIPVVQGNQLHGVVYIDKNHNGELDIEDERLENIGLELDDGQETASTIFGQFSFDYLPPGEYRLAVQEDTLPAGVVPDEGQDFTANLSGGGRSKFAVRLVETEP